MGSVEQPSILIPHPLYSIVLPFINPSFIWISLIFIILILIGFYDLKQTKHSLWRNFPIIGRLRWVLEELRPPFRQYFIESDIDGVPINRQQRTVAYRRSKKQPSTIPFGTKINVYEPNGCDKCGPSQNRRGCGRTSAQQPPVSSR